MGKTTRKTTSKKNLDKHKILTKEDGSAYFELQYELLKALMDSIPDSIYFKDDQNRFILVNSTKAKHRGVSPKEMIGKTDFNLLPRAEAQKAFNDDNAILGTGKSLINIEEQITQSDGSTKWVSVTKVPRFDKKGKIVGTIGISRDITEKKRAEQAVTQSEKKYRTFFELSPELIILIDTKGKIYDVNQRLYDWLGYRPRDIIGMGISELPFLTPASRIKATHNFTQRLLGTKLDPYELEFTTKRGEKRIGRIVGSAIKDEKGNLAGDLVMVSNITERKKAEQELKDLNTELESKVKERTEEIEKEKEEVAELLRQKTDFINQLSHDIRTPLTPIMTMASILRDKLADRDDKARFEIITRNAKYLNDLVEDTLKLAKLDLGKVKMRLTKVSVYNLVTKVVKLNEIIFKQRKIKIVIKIPKSLKLSVDSLRMNEVFENLIMNSLKFVKSMGQIIFDAQLSKDYATITVKDSGIGMTKKDLGNIFSEFYKADPSRHDLSTGLGLSICKRIVEKHNGEMWAESSGKGKGTTFFIKLPRDSSKRIK